MMSSSGQDMIHSQYTNTRTHSMFRSLAPFRTFSSTNVRATNFIPIGSHIAVNPDHIVGLARYQYGRTDYMRLVLSKPVGSWGFDTSKGASQIDNRIDFHSGTDEFKACEALLDGASRPQIHTSPDKDDPIKFNTKQEQRTKGFSMSYKP